MSPPNGKNVGSLLTATELAEFRKSLVVGYQIPRQRFGYLHLVPEPIAASLDPVEKGHTYRYLDGLVYAIDTKTYAVSEIIELVPKKRRDSRTGSTCGRKHRRNRQKLATPTTRCLPPPSVPTNSRNRWSRVSRCRRKRHSIFKKCRKPWPMPLPEQATDIEYRYLNGIVYTVDPFTNRILEMQTVAEITE